MTITDACAMQSVMNADASYVAAITDMPPAMMVATIITIVIISVIIIAIVIVAIVKYSGWTEEQTKPVGWIAPEVMGLSTRNSQSESDSECRYCYAP